jgi:hypothetical protein
VKETKNLFAWGQRYLRRIRISLFISKTQYLRKSKMAGRRGNPFNQIFKTCLSFIKRYFKHYTKTNLMKKRIRMMWCRWTLKLTKKTSIMIRYSCPEIKLFSDMMMQESPSAVTF